MEPLAIGIDTAPEQPAYAPLTWTCDDIPWSVCRHALSLLQPATFTRLASRLASNFSRLTRELLKEKQPKSQPDTPPPAPESAPATTANNTQPPPTAEAQPEQLVIFTRSDFKAYLLTLRDAFQYAPGIWKQFLQITNDFIAANNPASKQPTPSPA